MLRQPARAYACSKRLHAPCVCPPACIQRPAKVPAAEPLPVRRADEGDFVSLTAKHNFSMAHLGMALGMLRNSLQELQVQHCNDFFAVGNGTLSAVACLPRLRVLRIEDLHCRADRDTLAELAQLRGVRAPCLGRLPLR